nr:retrotransposon protein, putative, Ty1-copia subclass [Tanacetum cinerariifolium]
MEEMYGLMNYQEGVIQPNNYQPRRMFGSGSNIQATSSNDNKYKQQKNNELAEELEDDLLRETRAKILSHPLYPKLLQVYIDCQKVGAPTDIANLFDEIFKDNDFCRRSSSCSCLGDDPELDEFMETYCEMLDKYRSDLARPFDEATTFLNNMQTQLTNLCKGTTTNYNTDRLRHILLGLPVNDFKKILAGQFLIDKVAGGSGGFTRGKAQTKAELNKKPHSAVYFCFGNKSLREVTGETTATGVWSKLETLYMTKSLANKLYLKKKLYTFYMSVGRKIFEHIDEFNKIVLDLANIEVKFEDEDLALLLLTSLPASYEHFVETLLYGWEALTLEDSRGKSRLKSRGERLKCYIFQSEDHLKRNCSKNNRKKSTGYVKKDEQPSSSGSTYDDSELMMVMSAQAQALLDWIRDSGCSYHMTPRYIPKLNRNLISLGTLKKEGYTVKLQSGKVKVINGSRVILSGIRRDNCVYSLDGHAMASELNASVEEKTALRRYTTQEVIEYVHSDLWGPSQVKSLGGKRNFLSIVDDYSRRLCIESGIARHLTIVGTPQQNGVAECMNITLMDKVRCLLIQFGLPKTFWAEATCTTAYLINRSPSRAIEKKTPMKMWSGHLSNYGMLRIFGCVTYPHDKQGKLESRAVKCVLLGYPKGVKGYRLYRLNDESPKIVTSRNMVFNESVMYKDTLKNSGAGDKSVEELQVEVELQRLNNHTPEEDQTDQEDGNDEDVGDQETDQPPDLIDYQLVQDREPRTRMKPLRFQDESNIAAYTFVAAEEKDTHEAELVDHLAGQKLMSCKWLFKIKEWIEGVQKPRYKARLVARRFTQRAGIDYNEVFSLVVRHTSIRVILALTACEDYELEQFDVKTTFLHGNLEEVIYMKQPPGYEQGNKVSRSYASCEYIYLLLYINDMLIACKSKAEIGSTKSLLKKEFDMKELGEAKKILGIDIVSDRSRKILRVSQSGYISKILNNFRIDNEKSVKMSLGEHFKLSLKDYPVRDCDVKKMTKVPYANAVGSVMYLMVYTRPDIAYAATLQHMVTLSTTYAEYMALTEAVKEAIWLRGLLEELGIELNTVAVNCDNQSAIHLSRNHVFHERTKHINVRYHFIREVLKAKTVKVLNVGTKHNVVDALTKVVPGFKLQYCLELLNLESVSVEVSLVVCRVNVVVVVVFMKTYRDSFGYSDLGSLAVRMTVVESMVSGLHIKLGKNALGFETNGRNLEKNDGILSRMVRILRRMTGY